MKRFKQLWLLLLGVLLAVVSAFTVLHSDGHDSADSKPAGPAYRSHLDHTPFFEKPFKTGQEVTRACLECHEDAAQTVMKTAHYQWLGDEVELPRTQEKIRIGKKNLINNFCIGVQGNWDSCTRCHAGYGWKDAEFDFEEPENVDCLVCHDNSGAYAKGKAGNPLKEVDLLAVAKSVGQPKRENCGSCHHYGGGGLGVKHGDLDATLDNPAEYEDVHMGRVGMTCIDCHGGHGHDIRGTAFSVSIDHKRGIGCTDCHQEPPHIDTRINAHLEKVACQTCHIPQYATSIPTKMNWDWSKAGDANREEDAHHYLKKKGEFEYASAVTPEYYWFNLTVDRYLMGDKVAEKGPTVLNPLGGSKDDASAKIWPFKVHRGKQPFDTVNKYLISPRTSGEGGYWRTFDWTEALRLGAEETGLEFSGEHGFVETIMFWPLSHMVVPKEKALQCTDCHNNPDGRMNWRALGYSDDPMMAGGTQP